jgi:hypothetical protein
LFNRIALYVRLGVGLLAGGVLMLRPAPAAAVPIFAERYGFSCSTCHTAVPELNAFGNSFRRAGYQLPSVPRHKEIPIALRFQEDYMKDLSPAQTRRFNALAILISTANFGPRSEFSYFARYLFGSQGAPGSLYYGYLQHVAPKSGVYERAGLFNVPLIANATQRLDTLTTQPAYAYTVGHNSANFANPRWGAMFGQQSDRLDAHIGFSLDEYHGAAYGAPVPPSDFVQTFAEPELFASLTSSIIDNVRVGALRLSGKRNFRSQSNGSTFSDRYYRDGIQGGWMNTHFEIVGQQVWGHDTNADGFGTPVTSSGGFVTFKYRPTAHTYVGVRYDAVANPYATRDWDFYGVFPPTTQARFVIEYLRPINQPGAHTQLNMQLLFALPAPNWVK